MRSRALLAASLLALVVAGCPGVTGEAETCTARLSIRMPTPNPTSSGGETGDVVRVRVEQDGVETWAGSVDLFGAAQEGGDVPVVTLDTNEPPELRQSERTQVHLDVYASTPRRIVASGRSEVFACVGDVELTVPLYVGPANDWALTADSPGPRRGATASPLPDGRVLVTGGADGSGAAAVSAYVYDHERGSFCGDDCLSGDAAPREGHTATVLEDGRVLVVGGDDGGSAEPNVLVFDPATDSFSDLGVEVARSGHTATLLTGANTAAELRGQVLVAGGFDHDTGALTADAFVIDVDAASTTALTTPLSLARRDAAATMLASGKVLITGGRDGSGAPTAALDLFDTQLMSFDSAGEPCVSGTTLGGLCAARAGHTSTLLDDDSVLLVGGETAPVMDGAEVPGAEVFLIVDEQMLRATANPGALAPRTGHAVTRVSCLQSPCPVLVSGGASPVDGTPVAPGLFYPAASLPPSGATSYGGTYVVFSQTPATSSRDGVAAAPLADGAIYFAGGEEAGGAALASQDAVFSFCEQPEDSVLLCPDIAGP
jgi:hypothetical protein